MFDRNKVVYIFSCIVAAGIGSFIYVRFFQDLDKNLNLSPLLYGISFLLALIALIFGISSYLESNKNNDYVPKQSYRDTIYEELIEKYNISADKLTSEQAIEEAIKLLKDKFENISAENYFQEFKQRIKNETIVEILEKKAKSIEVRVQGEIGRLSRSGVINLSIGMLLSISGLLYLGSFVVNVQAFETFEGMIVNTFPKTIFVLLIEVFSYFFLKLYKQNLDDIKYYQNELTNIESKNLAVQISKQSNNHKLLTLCVEEFLSTERNFVLEKDQSTIEIEKERINSNNTNNTLQVLKDIFKNKV